MNKNINQNYVLQNRWKIKNNKLVYYGMRQRPYTTKNKIKINNSTKKIIMQLENKLEYQNNPFTKGITKLIKQGVIVEQSQKRTTPENFESATFCKNCIANDFMLPGLEFDESGLCPMCSNQHQDKNLNSVTPIYNKIEKSKKSRFDVAVFYTGGKDSTYLLYYFSKVLRLRVLALTWEIPFMSDNARQSIENAKKHLRNVEFVNRFVNPNDMKQIYHSLFQSQSNTCCCPNLAYMLFYPLLVEERIPYLAIGNEPVQMKGLYYNNIAPRIAYSVKARKHLKRAINFTRIITFRKPLKTGQFEMLKTVNQLASGGSSLLKLVGYENEILNNIDQSLKDIPMLQKSLKRVVRKSNFNGRIPALIHVDMNEISPTGIYDWNEIKELIIRETGWVSPKNADKLLHTSCAVEIAKDYSQFIRFYNMETTIMPFSALEISLASATKNISRQQAIEELKNSLGFTLIRPDEHKIMEACNGCPITKLPE